MRAKINKADLYYEVLGEDNNKAIMALHGGPGLGSHAKPKKAFAPLSDEYKLVVYDHRGCGDSSLTPPFENRQFADDAEGLRNYLDLGEIVMIGGSYGGFITQEYAIRHGENLAGFVLRDTAATHKYDEKARNIALDKLPKIKEMDLDIPHITEEELNKVMDGNVTSNEEFRRIFLGMLPLYVPDLDEFDPEAAKERVENVPFHYKTHNKTFTDEFPNMDYTPYLPDVDVPALVTVGRYDWITPVEASEEIADLLPDSRLKIFEKSGHSPNLDQQEEYLATVREFLAEIGY
ncbi:alpha/beta hydrolase [Candidatus Bipolaricaulota bacterium]|nr:alpha/beta hydrolase [Candidatus Bipolaricaulota bacterium]